MTPKEKSTELFLKFMDIMSEIDTHHSIGQEALDCATFLVQNLINEVDWYSLPGMKNEYWEEVKYELTQLDTLLL